MLETQYEKLIKGFSDIVPANSFYNLLKQSIESNRPLRVKYGIDPTSTHIHLGFTVGLRKLRQFQDFGHIAVLIIGDYTATIGDPSGKNKTRPKLSHEQVLQNAKTYLDQCFRILDRDKTEVHFNSSWFSKMNFQEMSELLSKCTVSQMLERLDFKTRYNNGNPIYLHEFVYPLMQGYDSVMVKSDIELGGTDQKFNVLRGRELQIDAEMNPQIGMFLPILLGTCGKEKMSKSIGNFVGIDEDAQTMYHKIYNIPDKIVDDWILLLTDLNLDCDIISKKKILAFEIVRQYYGEDVAKECEKKEIEIHNNKHCSDNLEIVRWKWESLKDCLIELGKYKSNSELKNAIKNKAIKIDGNVIVDLGLEDRNFVLSIGKNFIRKIEE